MLAATCIDTNACEDGVLLTSSFDQSLLLLCLFPAEKGIKAIYAS